jgi:hypothetical protein
MPNWTLPRGLMPLGRRRCGGKTIHNCASDIPGAEVARTAPAAQTIRNVAAMMSKRFTTAASPKNGLPS